MSDTSNLCIYNINRAIFPEYFRARNVQRQALTYAGRDDIISFLGGGKAYGESSSVG